MFKIITFYRERDEPHGCFSNFSKHGFEIDGTFWPTAEHYFQAMKFVGTPHEDEVHRAKSPMDAKNIGGDRSRPLRPDWEQVKDDVMRRAVLAKFEQNADIRKILLATGDARLVEDATNDYYWGCGAQKTGKNMLGIILMETREILRTRKAPE
jgi:ribA/ribD-fused uncharacterized protein